MGQTITNLIVDNEVRGTVSECTGNPKQIDVRKFLKRRLAFVTSAVVEREPLLRQYISFSLGEKLKQHRPSDEMSVYALIPIYISKLENSVCDSDLRLCASILKGKSIISNGIYSQVRSIDLIDYSIYRPLDWKKITSSVAAALFIIMMAVALGFLEWFLVQQNQYALFTVCTMFGMLPIGCFAIVWPFMLCQWDHRKDPDYDQEDQQQEEHQQEEQKEIDLEKGDFDLEKSDPSQEKTETTPLIQ